MLNSDLSTHDRRIKVDTVVGAEAYPVGGNEVGVHIGPRPARMGAEVEATPTRRCSDRCCFPGGRAVGLRDADAGNNRGGQDGHTPQLVCARLS